jgi:hypothetical protein
MRKLTDIEFGDHQGQKSGSEMVQIHCPIMIYYFKSNYT